MADKTDQLIQEIAAQHGVAVSRDDPILILQTINERLLQDSAQSQQVILDHFKEEMELIAHRWNADSKDKAERTLNAALAASKTAMSEMTQQGASTTADAVRAEADRAVKRFDTALRRSEQIARTTLVAAGITLSAVVIFAGAVLFWR